MKQGMRYIMLGLIAVFFIAGCSKQPLREINDAKSAVDSIMSDGAEKYLPDDAKKINDDLNKAMEEVKAQDAKIVKNFDKAKEMLAAVKTEAEAVNSKLPAIKEEAKKGAISEMENAKTAIEATRALFEKTSRKKDLKSSVETFRAEVKNLEDSFKELQAQVEREDYLTIASRAAEIRDKASELSTLIKQTPAKTAKKEK